MACELSVVLKDEERRYTQKFLIYEDITIGMIPDPSIENAIKEAQQNFQGEPEDITIKVVMVWK